MRQLTFVVVCCLLVPVLSRAVWAVPIECPKVISAISHSSDLGLGRGPDISEIAKKLGTSVAWIEHCMRVYGRRPRRPGLESAEGREGRLEALEDFEAEEPLEMEDRGEPDAPNTRQKEPRVSKKPTPDGSGD